MDCVRAPWLLTSKVKIVSAKSFAIWKQTRQNPEESLNLRPYITFSEHAGNIASPITACPPQALLEELWVIFQSSKHFTFRMILHVCLVMVRNHPPGQEIVVVCVELVLTEPPFLVGKAIGEFDVLEDAGAVSAGAARQARYTSIHVSCGSAIKITTFQVKCPKESIYPLREGRMLSSSQPLTGDHAPVLLVLERSQHPLKSSDRPCNIIISKDDNLGGDLRDRSGHLTPFVCVLDRHTSDPLIIESRHFVHGSLGLVHILINCDQNQFLGLVLQDRGDGPLQFFSFAIQRWQNDCNIRWSQSGVYWNWDRFECPEGPQIDDKSKIAVEAGIGSVHRWEC